MIHLLDGIVWYFLFAVDCKFCVAGNDFSVRYYKKICSQQHCCCRQGERCIPVDSQVCLLCAVGIGVFVYPFFVVVAVIGTPECQGNTNEHIQLEISFPELTGRCFNCHFTQPLSRQYCQFMRTCRCTVYQTAKQIQQKY